MFVMAGISVLGLVVQASAQTSRPQATTDSSRPVPTTATSRPAMFPGGPGSKPNPQAMLKVAQRTLARLTEARSKNQATPDQWLAAADTAAKVSDAAFKKQVLSLLADGIREDQLPLAKLGMGKLSQLASAVDKMGGDPFIKSRIEKRLADMGPVEKLDGAVEAGARPSKDATKRLTEVISLIKQVGDKSPEVSDGTCDALAATFFQQPKDVKLLEEAMVGSDGEVDLTAVKVLAWHYRRQGNRAIRGFTGRLDKKIKEGKFKGDALARLDLAAAYACGLINEMFARRTDGDEYIRWALSAAVSDDVKVLCLEELTSAGIAAGSYKYPQKIIHSMMGQFDPAQQAKLTALADDLAKRQKEQEQAESAGGKKG